MKLLWHSNSPGAHTGYGNQTGLFVPRIHGSNGFQVAVSAFYGIQLPMALENGIMMLPTLWDDQFGNGIIQAHVDFTKADVVFSLIDPFALDVEVWRRLPWAAWCPVDSEPDKPGNIARLRHARWVIAMSQFGKGVLEAAGLDPVYYVPHGVDTNAFKPVDRELARKNLGDVLGVDLTGKKVVVSNMANKGFPSRKNFDALLQAWQGLLKVLPESVLILHTEKEGRMNGEHLPTMIRTLNLPENSVIFPHQYQYLMGMIGNDYLNDLYNAADLYVQPSQGEGFGIPIIEAQAAGCPVVVTNFSSMPELVFAGKAVDGFPVMSVPGAFQRKISVPGLMNAMHEILTLDNADYLKLREKAREGALEYDIDRVFKKYMLPVLEQIRSDLVPKVSLANRREIRRLKRQAKNGQKKDDDMPVKVSVLFPAYNLIENYPDGLAEKAIFSALNQPGIRVQLCVVDDGSTDNTYDFLKKMRDRYDGITLLKHTENKGSSEAANTAASAASGEYFVIQSARAWWEPGALVTMAKALDDQPGIGFVYGSTQYWGDRQDINTPPPFAAADFNTGFPSSFGYLYRRAAWDHGCRYTPYLKVEGKTLCIGDRDFMLQLIHKMGWHGLALPELLALNYLYSLSKGNQMTNLLIKYRAEMTEKMRERWPMTVGEA